MERWRQALVDQSTRIIACLFVPYVIFLSFLPLFQSHPMFASTIWLSAAAVSLSAWRSLTYRLRASLFLAAVSLLFTGALFLLGWAVFVTLSGVAAILVGGLFFNNRMATIALGFAAAIGLLHAYLLSTGDVTIDVNIVDPNDPMIAVRFTASFLLGTSFVAIGISHIVNKLSLSLSENVEALEGMSRESRAREAAERESKQAQDRLVEMQKMEAVGRLGAAVAHDINNSIQVIIGWAEFLRMDSEDGDVSQQEIETATAGILEACAVNSQLAHQILTLGKGHTGQRTVTDLGDILDRMQNSLHRLLGDDVHLSLEGEQTAYVFADSVELQQIILNLCINARDAMQSGGVLTIKLDTESDEVVLSVADEGVGMNDMVRSKIFEPFFTTKGEGKGSGLGLSTVKRMVEESGGSVSVESVEGAGSTFFVRLPLREALAFIQPKDRPVDVDLHGRRILVVDDDKAVRQIVFRQLSERGAEVATAARAEDGVTMLESGQKFDLVCCDAVMPGRGARYLIDSLPSFEHSPRFLLISGYVGDELVRKGIRSDELNFLPKPFTRQQLLLKIAEVLAKCEEGSPVARRLASD